MPKVDGAEFPYDEEGVIRAKAWSEMTGKPIEIHGKFYNGGEIPQYGLGGWLKKKAKKAKNWMNKTGNKAKDWTDKKMFKADKWVKKQLGVKPRGHWVNYRTGVDPNLFGSRDKFAGSDISGLLSSLQDAKAGGGPSAQSSPLQGRSFKKGGKIPKGYHT